MIRANTREFVDLVKTGGIGEIRRAGWEIEDQLESSTVLGRGSSLSLGGNFKTFAAWNGLVLLDKLDCS